MSNFLKNLVERSDNLGDLFSGDSDDLFFGNIFGSSSPRQRGEEIQNQAANAGDAISNTATATLPEPLKSPVGTQGLTQGDIASSNALGAFFTTLDDTLTVDALTVNNVDSQVERPLENPLNEFKTTQYNLQLFMVDRPVQDEDELIRIPRDERIMLAETASTPIQIEDLQILSAPGSASYNRVVNPLRVRMTLHEHTGLTLPVRVANAVRDFSSVRTTFRNVPWYLIVYFGAREDDNNPIAVQFGEQRKVTKGFKLVPMTIKTEVDTTGTKYVVEAAAQSFEVLKETNAALKTSVTITEQEVEDNGNNARRLLETENSGSLFFTSYFDAIKQHINDIKKKMSQEGDQSGDLQKELDSYETFLKNEYAVRFEGFNDPSVFDFVYKTDKSQNSDHDNEKPFDLKFDKGTDILNAIVRMFENTKLHYKLAPGIPPKSNVDTSSGLGFFDYYSIDTDAFMVKTDQDLPTNKNYYKFIYTVRAKKLPAVADKNEPPVLRKDTLLENGYLPYGVRLYKHYPYYFTGQNDSVLAFNIELDMTWFSRIVASRSAQLTINAAPGQTKQQGDQRIVSEGQAEDAPAQTSTQSRSVQQEIERAQIDVTTINDDMTDQDAVTDATREGDRQAATITAKELLDNSVPMMAGEIEVRGDPDWFAYNHPEEPFVLVEVNNINVEQYYDAEEPIKEFEPEPLVTNIYQVIGIEDNFEAGQYTQKLKLVKKDRWTVEK